MGKDCVANALRYVCSLSGECGAFMQSPNTLHFNGSQVHRIVPGQYILGGDISTNADGSGGESIYGEPFTEPYEADRLDLKHDRPGLLSMQVEHPHVRTLIAFPESSRHHKGNTSPQATSPLLPSL